MKDKDILYAIELRKALCQRFDKEDCQRLAKIDFVSDRFVKLDRLLAWYIDKYKPNVSDVSDKCKSDVNEFKASDIFKDYRYYERFIHDSLMQVAHSTDFPKSMGQINDERELLHSKLDARVDSGVVSYDIYNRLSNYLDSLYLSMLSAHVFNTDILVGK